MGWWREPRLSKSGGVTVWSAGSASAGENIASQHVIPTTKIVANIHPPVRFAIARCSAQVQCNLGLLRSFVLINVPNKDCASLVIYEGFDPSPELRRPIASSFYVMTHTFLADT